MSIVAAIDFSGSTDPVVRTARHLAEALGCRVWLIHVAEPDPDFVGYEGGPDAVRDQVAARYQREHRELHGLADRLRAAGIDATALLVQGQTVETIVETAQRYVAELIVMGSHGHGAVWDLLVGSVSEGVIRRASCPVVVVPTATREG